MVESILIELKGLQKVIERNLLVDIETLIVELARSPLSSGQWAAAGTRYWSS